MAGASALNKTALAVTIATTWLVKLGVLPEALAAGAGITRKHLYAVLRGDRWMDVDDERSGRKRSPVSS